MAFVIRRSPVLLFVLPLLATVRVEGAEASASAAESWRALLNGRDLSGWTVSLPDIPPPGSPTKLKQEGPPVFSFVTMDGGPCLAVSGRLFGTLISNQAYANYHLKLEFKWGTKQWPPRENGPRDSGVFYHTYDAPSPTSPWPKAVEFQIEPEHTGDSYSVGTRLTERSRRVEKPTMGIFDPAAAAMIFEPKGPNSRHCMHSADFETTGWNTVELICLGNQSIHVVNGHVVLRIDRIQRGPGADQPDITAGKISLQSEGAEIFYRNVQLRPITEIPPAFREKQQP